MWGEMLVLTICKKSPAKATMVITAAKCQEVAALRQAVLAITDVATLFGGVGESCFLSKRIAKWYKRLKDCSMRRPKTEKTDRFH
jgi:hypothetical protein